MITCTKNGQHKIPENGPNFRGPHPEIHQAIAAAYEGCTACTMDMEQRVQFNDDGLLTAVMMFIWLASQAQVRASQRLEPVSCADELFPGAILKDLNPTTRRYLRRIVLTDLVEAPCGLMARQPDGNEIVEVITSASVGERYVLWQEALSGAVGIVMMETFRI
ncbi:hypothetical protein J7E97_00945 [Streptomyces sp. ISL-66]|uniref:hypothetical protein n=1 Tax=Streptomyces sp. ISL-66 TaxID=2819186 RepID=UPI001BE8656A|nr:hypothetical protein [Streptomyces sp. ISL-66]MBT2466466.1 hypothetical protein [Streptomyces sp. ISL-66]